jgi:hypothetical protein
VFLRRVDTVRPSSIALALIAIFALVVGWWLNVSLVPGRYKWLGLFRIFWAMSHRPAFWAFGLAIWLVGLRDAPSARHALSRRSREVVTMWVALSAAVLVFQFIAPHVVSAGSVVDAVCFSLLLPGFVIHAFAAPGSDSDRLREARRLLLTAAATLLVCTLVGYVYTMLKGALFIETPPRDDVLWAADARLLGDDFYLRVAVFRTTHPSLIRVLDLAYVGLIQQLWWSLFYFYGSKDVVRGRPYVLAMFIVYVLGPLAYFVVPSRGPLFARPDLFVDLVSLAPDSWHLSRYLFRQTAMTVQGLAHSIAPFCFIAAMPSLHVAQSLVMLLGMRRSLAMCIFNGAMLMLTIASTTLLGWHYFVDDIAGVALGLICWFLAQAIIRRDNRVDGSAGANPDNFNGTVLGIGKR